MEIMKKFRLMTLIIMCNLWQACFFKSITPVFMVGFPENFAQLGTSLRITVINSAKRQIEVSVASSLWQHSPYYVASGTSLTITLGSEFMVKGSTQTTHGIEITTSGAARVYAEEVPLISPMEGTLVIPRHLLGRCYIVVAGTPTEGATQSEVLIVGVIDNTFVTVMINSTTPVVYNRVKYFDGEVIDMYLDKFDTAQIQSDMSDLTGTYIEASQPVSVFSANQAILIDGQDGFMLEQMLPIDVWHTHYVTVPPIGSFYACRMVAASPDTLVWYRCDVTSWQSISLRHLGSDVTLEFGDVVCEVIATQPIMLTMIIHSGSHDPSMVALQPIKDTKINVFFHVSDLLDHAQLMLVTFKVDLNSILIDGQPATNLSFSSVNTDVVSVVENVVSGVHSIITSGLSLRISGYVFGRFYNNTVAYSIVLGRNGTNAFDQEIPGFLENDSSTAGMTQESPIATPVLAKETTNKTTVGSMASVNRTIEPVTGTVMVERTYGPENKRISINNYTSTEVNVTVELGKPETTSDAMNAISTSSIHIATSDYVHNVETTTSNDGYVTATEMTSNAEFATTTGNNIIDVLTTKVSAVTGVSMVTEDATTTTAAAIFSVVMSTSSRPETTTSEVNQGTTPTAAPGISTGFVTTEKNIKTSETSVKPITNRASITLPEATESTMRAAITGTTTGGYDVSGVSGSVSQTPAAITENTSGTRAPGGTSGTRAPGGTSGTRAPGGTSGTRAPGGTSGTRAPGGTSGTRAPGGTSGTRTPGGTSLMAGTTSGPTSGTTIIEGNTSTASDKSKIKYCDPAFKITNCFTYCNYTKEGSIRLEDIRANLIDRKKTRRYMRTLMSAQDDRMSVQTIGYTGVIVLVSVFLFIVILDLEACKPRKRNQSYPV